MTGREKRQEEILSAYLDDLLMDRAPVLPDDAHEVFSEAGLAGQIATLRLLKGALRPSHVRAGFDDSLLTELRQQVREQVAQPQTQGELGKIVEFARVRRNLRRGEVSRQIVGMTAGRIKDLERGVADPLSLPAEAYVSLCRLLEIPRRDLAASLGLAARQWTANLSQRRRINGARAIPAGVESAVPQPEVEQGIATFERDRQVLLTHYLRAILVGDSQEDEE